MTDNRAGAAEFLSKAFMVPNELNCADLQKVTDVGMVLGQPHICHRSGIRKSPLKRSKKRAA